MPYEVPQSKASIKQNRFEFTLPGSPKVHSLPLLKHVSMRVMELAGSSDIGLIAIVDHYDAKLGDKLRDLDGEQLEGLVKEWQSQSGVELGESSASSTS